MSQVCMTNGQTMALKGAKSWACITTGIFFAACGGMLLYFKPTVEDTPAWAVQAVAGCFLAIGGLCLLGRSGAKLDREAGTVIRWWGLIIPLFKSARRVSPEAVRLSHQEMRYRGQTSHWYPITLECTGDRIELDRPDKVMPAWTLAQNVATFLGVELVDESQMAAG